MPLDPRLHRRRVEDPVAGHCRTARASVRRVACRAGAALKLRKSRHNTVASVPSVQISGGEPSWIRTSDLLINFPLRLSPPPSPGFVVWTFPSPYPVAGT